MLEACCLCDTHVQQQAPLRSRWTNCKQHVHTHTCHAMPCIRASVDPARMCEAAYSTYATYRVAFPSNCLSELVMPCHDASAHAAACSDRHAHDCHCQLRTSAHAYLSAVIPIPISIFSGTVTYRAARPMLRACFCVSLYLCLCLCMCMCMCLYMCLCLCGTPLACIQCKTEYVVAYTEEGDDETECPEGGQCGEVQSERGSSMCICTSHHIISHAITSASHTSHAQHNTFTTSHFISSHHISHDVTLASHHIIIAHVISSHLISSHLIQPVACCIAPAHAHVHHVPCVLMTSDMPVQPV